MEGNISLDKRRRNKITRKGEKWGIRKVTEEGKTNKKNRRWKWKKK